MTCPHSFSTTNFYLFIQTIRIIYNVKWTVFCMLCVCGFIVIGEEKEEVEIPLEVRRTKHRFKDNERQQQQRSRDCCKRSPTVQRKALNCYNKCIYQVIWYITLRPWIENREKKVTQMRKSL